MRNVYTDDIGRLWMETAPDRVSLIQLDGTIDPRKPIHQASVYLANGSLTFAFVETYVIREEEELW